MSETKIKKLEKDLEEQLAAKAKAKDSKKLAFTKKIKKIRENLKTEREKTEGLASRSTKGMNYGATTKAKRQTDKQSGDSRSAPRKDLGNKDPFRFRTQRLESLAQTVGQDPLGKSAGSKKKTKGGKDTISSDQKSKQASLPKDKDSFGSRLAKAMGDKRSKKEMIRDREMNEKDEEEMGRNKGGAIKKKYGMRAGGFTKRGGMYKKGY